MASTAARLDAAQVEDKRNLRRVVAASFIFLEHRRGILRQRSHSAGPKDHEQDCELSNQVVHAYRTPNPEPASEGSPAVYSEPSFRISIATPPVVTDPGC